MSSAEPTSAGSTNESCPILELLEWCVAENSDEAWRALLRRCSGLIRQSYARSARGNLSLLTEFEVWLPGWLFSRRKIQATYRGLMARIDPETTAALANAEHLFGSYFANVLSSAVAEFHEERSLQEHASSQEYLDLIEAPKSPTLDDPIPPQVRLVIAKLPVILRVPLRLRFYPADELQPEDFQWIVERAGWDRQRVLDSLKRAREAHSNKKYPVGSELIGQMTGYSPDANGKFSAVDQAIRRAIMKLREEIKNE